MLKAVCHADPDPAISVSAAPDLAFATEMGRQIFYISHLSYYSVLKIL
jgi:hypothetical protein